MNTLEVRTIISLEARGYGKIPENYKEIKYMMHKKDELIISLTIEYPEYNEIEVKITNPSRSIRTTIDKMIEVFQLPKIDRWGSQIPYVLGIYEGLEEPIVLEFEDEDGNEVSLLDYDIKPGDHLVLSVLPYLG